MGGSKGPYTLFSRSSSTSFLGVNNLIVPADLFFKRTNHVHAIHFFFFFLLSVVKKMLLFTVLIAAVYFLNFFLLPAGGLMV
jgi:hypothetical protein